MHPKFYTALMLLYSLLILCPLAQADNLNLPDNLELIGQNGEYITIRYKETGFIREMIIDGPPKNGPGWDSSLILSSDTCFHFTRKFITRPLIYNLFGDADHDGLTEVLGCWGTYTHLMEYTGHDSTFIEQDSLTIIFPMAYGGDADYDGKAEFMEATQFGMVLHEAANSFGYPIDSVFFWDWDDQGGPSETFGAFADLDGDGVIELTFRPRYGAVYAIRNVGDNQYEEAYTINMTEATLGYSFNYVYGDFDNDLRNEVVMSNMNGLVYAYECVQPDSFVLVWMSYVSHLGASHIAGPTDMDSDGKKEFIVKASSIAQGGVFYYFFEYTRDNQFVQVAADSLTGNGWALDEFGLWDFDNDGVDELAVNTGYYIGLMKAVGDNDFEFIYVHHGEHGEFMSGNHIFPYDIDRNGYGEIGLFAGVHEGEGLIFYEYTPGRDILGDINCDCSVTLEDCLYLVNYFRGYDFRLPPNQYLTDVNGDCFINGLDVTYLVNYFHYGPALIHGDCR